MVVNRWRGNCLRVIFATSNSKLGIITIMLPYFVLPVFQATAILHITCRVVHNVPALTTNFWEVVARRFGSGLTAHQCCRAYHEQATKVKAPSTRPRKKEKQKVLEEGVTAKVGTLKRKRQLRNALEQLDKDYFDDIFDSTPFKKIKKSVMVSAAHTHTHTHTYVLNPSHLNSVLRYRSQNLMMTTLRGRRAMPLSLCIHQAVLKAELELLVHVLQISVTTSPLQTSRVD